MATKDKAAKQAQETAVAEEAQEAPAAEANAQEAPAAEANAQEAPAIRNEWDEEEEIFVPRKAKGDEQQYYVCVNDRRYMVPANGRVQKLPRPIAEVLKSGLAAEERAETFADSIPDKMA